MNVTQKSEAPPGKDPGGQDSSEESSDEIDDLSYPKYTPPASKDCKRSLKVLDQISGFGSSLGISGSEGLL